MNYIHLPDYLFRTLGPSAMRLPSILILAFLVISSNRQSSLPYGTRVRPTPLRCLSFFLAIFLAGSPNTQPIQSSPRSQSLDALGKLASPFLTLKHRLPHLFSLSLRQRRLNFSRRVASRLDDQLSTRDVTVQLFQWRHSDVAKECEQFLGPAGYRYVQISPVHEHITGPQWWTDYQPVSYRIGSKRGSESEFDDMVERCGRSGVGVIADVVMNHMTAGNPHDARLGSVGSSYKKYDYPNLYSRNDFHNCGKNGNNEIKNYSDRYEVQNCELVGLADLDTAKNKVQRRLRAFLKHLVHKGVLGFRVDAAKHIPATNLLTILADLSVRVVQEVMYVGGQPIRPEEYMSAGRVHIFQGASDLKRMFLTDGIAYLGSPVPWGDGWGDGYLPSSHSQVFVTNWDLERNQVGLRMDLEPSIYLLCQTFLLTWDYGQVDVYSGYNFTNYNDGPREPTVECGRDGWRCEHRHLMIVGAIRLRAASAGERVQNVLTSGAQRLAFNRGSKVFVALNNEDSPWDLKGIPLGLSASHVNQPFENLLSSTEAGEVIEVRLDDLTGKMVLGSVSVPGRSAIGLMIV